MRVLLLLTGVTLALCAVPRTPTARHFRVEDADGSYTLVSVNDGATEYLGQIGRKATDSDDGVSLSYDAVYHEDVNGYRVSITWDGPSDAVFEDCLYFGNKHWYAGPEQKDQYWPIQNSRLEKYSIISKEADNSAVSERYWLNSLGQYVIVAPEVPLFADYHNVLYNHICFIAEVTDPYSTKRTHNVLKYDIWFFENAKLAHQHAVNTYLGKPTGHPDYRMIQYPIWSTWARYAADIDHDLVLEYANEIVNHGFPNSQLEIDDLWEICYGSLTVDEQKFPDMKKLVEELKGMDFRVSIWAHPFINSNCEPWFSEAAEKGYLIFNEDGSTATTWWKNNGSIPGHVDFTKTDAANWYGDRIQQLLDTYDIDSVKFDAGESSWSPQIPVQEGYDIDLHPSHIVQTYLRKVAEFGPMIEIRSGMRTQELPVFVRMVDKDSEWGFNNGLVTLITTLLTMNLNGYTMVLPDMIGGNGYDNGSVFDRITPSRELFIRWLQANVFMPSLQYSYVPWDYDNEAIEICRKYTQLHADYADEIVAAMEASIQDGTPVNAPIWWVDPTDQYALGVYDEFLLGEKILAAPVVVEGAVTRDVYLPAGTWRDGNTYDIVVGPIMLHDYPAPLDVLPYFIKQ